MKAIRRNFLLTIIGSTFAMFGALGGQGKHHSKASEKLQKVWIFSMTEGQKETFTCIGVALTAWVLCFWRCAAIRKRLRMEREYQMRFNEYMRRSPLQRFY